MTRRDLTGVLAAGSAGLLSRNPLPARTPAPFSFPQNFLWGCATAAHQVEGNNVGSDFWLLEHLKNTIFAEPSGDACDHYHLYRQDLQTVAKLGFNAYRFSIEWARVEPEPGCYSRAELEHYRRLAAACRELSLTPVATFHHFTSPRWLAAAGGWEEPSAADRFVRFCERTSRHLGDLLGGAATFNEPNIGVVLASMPMFRAMPVQSALEEAARAVGSNRFSSFLLGDPRKNRDTMLIAHRRAFEAIKAGPGRFPVGLTLALSDDQAVAGGESRRDRMRAEHYGAFLESARKDDFLGVQTYTRSRTGPEGALPNEPGVEVTQMGYEFYPEALEQTIRYAISQARVPVIVTENGIGTEDDSRRSVYIERALTGVARCLRDGLDVRGYFYWSLLDNFEWMLGYRPKFGLVAVNRETQERTVKPSARYIGGIARRNAL